MKGTLVRWVNGSRNCHIEIAKVILIGGSADTLHGLGQQPFRFLAKMKIRTLRKCQLSSGKASHFLDSGVCDSHDLKTFQTTTQKKLNTLATESNRCNTNRRGWMDLTKRAGGQEASLLRVSFFSMLIFGLRRRSSQYLGIYKLCASARLCVCESVSLCAELDSYG